jgi:tRNA (guanine26-N2/guanine27-N2)-dimethyltransferase
MRTRPNLKDCVFTMPCLHQGKLTRLRALRVAKELPDSHISSITACDLSETSREIFMKNLKLNEIENDPRISYVLSDTNKHMFGIEHPFQYNIIDLDPYGSAVPFLYAALQAITDGGMLCITCTDTRVLCGADKHKCYYLYGSARGGNDTIEETALRILHYTISKVAAIIRKSIKVLLSVQSDFYVRVFVQVHDGKRNCWDLLSQHGLEFYCKGCGVPHYQYFGHENKKASYSIDPLNLPDGKCPNCSEKWTVSNLISRPSLARQSVR